MFKAFRVNLTSIQTSSQNPHKPMEIDHSPHTHTHGIPVRIPIPAAAEEKSLSLKRNVFTTK